MKLVREQLYEKFKEDTDPINDLGIGVIPQFIKALKRDTHTEDIMYAYEQTIRRFRKKYPQVDWLKIFNKLPAHALIESFTEDKSDPIKDMGIGVMSLFIKQLKKDANDDEDIEYAYQQTLIRFHKKYPEIDWVKIFNELPEDALDNVPVNGGYPSIDEAFTEDESDPITDMGIGGYSYETLRPGAIIKSKRMGFAVTKNQSGQFTDWASGNKLWPENILLVYRVVRYGENFKDVYFKKYHEKEADLIPGMIQKIKDGELPWGGQTSRMIVSKKKFDYRFTVVQKGI